MYITESFFMLVQPKVRLSVTGMPASWNAYHSAFENCDRVSQKPTETTGKSRSGWFGRNAQNNKTHFSELPFDWQAKINANPRD
jgi:hypothetical protein